KTLAHAFILPLLGGSGSNLKTAEALWSRAWIVTTRPAFRGFDEYLKLPQVVLSEPGSGFGSAIATVLQRAKPDVGAEQSAMLDALTWRHTLGPLRDYAERIGRPRRQPAGTFGHR